MRHFNEGDIVENGEQYEHAISQGWLVPVREPTGQMAFRVVRGFALGRTGDYEWRRSLDVGAQVTTQGVYTHTFHEGSIVYFEGNEDGPDLTVDPRIRAAFLDGWLVLMGRVLGVTDAGPTPSRVPVMLPRHPAEGAFETALENAGEHQSSLLHTQQPMGPQAWAKKPLVSTVRPRTKTRYDFILDDDDFG